MARLSMCDGFTQSSHGPRRLSFRFPEACFREKTIDGSAGFHDGGDRLAVLLNGMTGRHLSDFRKTGLMWNALWAAAQASIFRTDDRRLMPALQPRSPGPEPATSHTFDPTP
jgi:hypothetical protein